jgi:hypothetical protein
MKFGHDFQKDARDFDYNSRKDALDFGYKAFQDERTFGEGVRQYDLTRRDKLFSDERKHLTGGMDGLGGAPGGKPAGDLDMIRDIEYRDRLFSMTPAERSQMAGETAASILALRQPGGFGTQEQPPALPALSPHYDPRSGAQQNPYLTQGQAALPARSSIPQGVYEGQPPPVQTQPAPRREGTINGIPESQFMAAFEGARGTPESSMAFLEQTYRTRNLPRRAEPVVATEGPQESRPATQRPTGASPQGKAPAAPGQQPVSANNKQAQGKTQKQPVTELTANQIEQSKVEYDGPARTPHEAIYGKQYSNPRTLLTRVQEFAGQTQVPDAPKFGEDEVAFSLRKSGFSSDLQTLKNMSKRLREKYPDLTPGVLASLIQEAKNRKNLDTKRQRGL